MLPGNWHSYSIWCFRVTGLHIVSDAIFEKKGNLPSTLDCKNGSFKAVRWVSYLQDIKDAVISKAMLSSAVMLIEAEDSFERGSYLAAIFPFFNHILAHIHAMVLVYTPKYRPFNMLSNGVRYLTIYAFVYELQVEMYLVWTASVAKYQSSTKLLIGWYFHSCYVNTSTTSHNRSIRMSISCFVFMSI